MPLDKPSPDTAAPASLAAALPLLPTGWKLILVPHEVDDHHLKEIEKRFDGRLHRWSEKESPTQHPVLLIDTVGLLMNLYSYGQVAWIGGGFGKAGVHNVLEPAVYGIPCLFGPIYHQFIEAAALVHDGGAEVIETPTAFAEALHTYNDAPDLLRLTGIAARDYVLSHSGATNRVMSYIAGLLGDV
ncbi:MAG: hypothetical protein EBZ77_15485 [Chitinophagia bacterium]|nr:hypothetical protein [Chitinophagia bacterium]